MLSFIGTGLTDTSKQSVKFIFGNYCMEVNCLFDPTTDCFHCHTPKFDDACEENINWPLECNIEITLNGSIYILCETKFLIYCIILFLN